MLVKYIGSLSEESTEFKELCNCLPEDVEKGKENLLKCVRGPFFQQAVEILDSATKQSYSGQQLSQMFGYSYTGEGPRALLEGLRNKGLQEKLKKQDSQSE
ncbi:hypothetical protein KDRO_D01280 [Kluyveromyces lactis]|nr:hypothetical protein KDRO_D01280 [Kluyveromyces lactis]